MNSNTPNQVVPQRTDNIECESEIYEYENVVTDMNDESVRDSEDA